MPRRPSPAGAALLLGILLAFAAAFRAMATPEPRAASILVLEPRSPEVGDELPSEPRRRDDRWRYAEDELDTGAMPEQTEDDV